jgi:membrane-bound lytic murein transglycosylase D
MMMNINYTKTLFVCALLGLGGCAVTPDDNENNPTTTAEATSGNTSSVDKKGQHYQSLWTRITAGYELQPNIDAERYAKSLAFYLRNHKHFYRLSYNAAPYLHYIAEAVEQRGMPMEIALLPAIESSYRPTARSPKSAAGIWQFIPGTGRVFGLEQNKAYDGRQDIAASTEAALNYLQLLHDKMGGDWLNAIAAYNCGEGRVLKEIKKNQAQGKPTDYWSLNLPKETRGYVPSLLAVAAIVKYSDHYGIALPDIPNQPYVTMVETNERVDLETVASLIDMPLPELRYLNPGFKKMYVGAPYVLVPVDKADVLQQKLANAGIPQTTDSVPIAQVESPFDAGESPFTQLVAAQTHEVKDGETLRDIAHQYQTSTQSLAVLNKIDRKSSLSAGTVLQIPAVQAAINQ